MRRFSRDALAAKSGIDFHPVAEVVDFDASWECRTLSRDGSKPAFVE
jgi:hypothetical protein